LPNVLETHRSFVNTWECDENQHMNVQFYAKRFEEARRVFDLLATGKGAGAPVRDRHIRFHAELHAGATTVTRSAVIAGGAFAGRVVHMLYHSETGVLSATALEPAGDGVGGAHAIEEDAARQALPRSVEAAPLTAFPAEKLVDLGGLAANFSVALPSDCDPEGRLTERALVGRFSDSAPHAWKASGVDVNWLLARNLGRVAVEMKITRHADTRPGDVLALYSAPVACSGKTVTLHHELVRLETGEPVASGRVVALILDLTTRRPTELPAPVVAHLQKAARTPSPRNRSPA
jgi:acyl-CoA thioester hydrolase